MCKFRQIGKLLYYFKFEVRKNSNLKVFLQFLLRLMSTHTVISGKMTTKLQSVDGVISLESICYKFTFKTFFNVPFSFGLVFQNV